MTHGYLRRVCVKLVRVLAQTCLKYVGHIGKEKGELSVLEWGGNELSLTGSFKAGGNMLSQLTSIRNKL